MPYDGSVEQLFYSRRIGRAPQRGVGLANGHVEVPETSPILGAAKLSGQLGNGWSLGLLNATTGAVHARMDSLGVRWEEPVEPLTSRSSARGNTPSSRKSPTRGHPDSTSGSTPTRASKSPTTRRSVPIPCGWKARTVTRTSASQTRTSTSASYAPMPCCAGSIGPGSALFLVWSQGRTGFDGDGSFRLRHDASELFGAPATNVFLIKLNYWLNI